MREGVQQNTWTRPTRSIGSPSTSPAIVEKNYKPDGNHDDRAKVQVGQG
jgi:hypothetical protein